MPKIKKEKVGPEKRHQMLPTRDEVKDRKIKVKVKGGAQQKETAARAKGDDSEDDDGDEYLSTDMTRKILEQARQQRDEMEVEEADRSNKRSKVSLNASTNGDPQFSSARRMNQVPSRAAADSDDSEEEDDADEDGLDDEELDGSSIGGIGMSEGEERLVASFMNAAPLQRRSLADIIMEKIKEKEEGEARAAGAGGEDEDDDGMPRLPPKVVDVYSAIGRMLKNYTAGKLPKAFKIIPSLTNWEQVLWLTKPETWSSHAMLAATKLFASNFNAKMAQRFYNIFLLEACRTDIQENKRLNYHLYEALRKSVYKPAAFYKGMVLPLASSGDCTLREASIFASVLARVTIPANHSAVALLKLAQLPYNGATSLFIRVLLNKKYALPFKVIDTLVDHFMSFISETRDLPVLWHQSLLVFAQRYRGDITRADKDRLKELLKAKPHHQITPEVRRQLFMGGCRGDPKTVAPTPGVLATPGSGAMAVG